jgi:phage baseplate assembly protein W
VTTEPSFGQDLSCISDLTSEMRMVSGRILHAEAIARRLQTPRGRLIDDPNYGFDLTGYIDDDVSPADIARIQASSAAECLKDQRTLAATVTIQFLSGVLIVSILLTDAAGPFSLVLSISAVTTQILAVSQ